MASFKSVITNQGNELLTKALVENKELLIHKVQIGDGVTNSPVCELTNIISPVIIKTRLSARRFEAGNPSVLRITVQTLNEGLISPVAIREIGLFATLDLNSEPILFSYSWLEGEDTDNVIPVPMYQDISDTMHTQDIGLFITNQENSNIVVSFAFDSFVNYSTLVDYVNSMIGNIDIEGSPILNKINTNVGQPTDNAEQNGNTLFKLVKWIRDKLVNIWTDTRASKLDNLDATISSRSPASTALSNTVWTNGRAASIDVIDIRTNTINNNTNTTNTNIGQPSDNANASTLFGRILQGFSNSVLRSVWTDARAGYLDKLNASNNGVSIIKYKERGMLSWELYPSDFEKKNCNIYAACRSTKNNSTFSRWNKSTVAN